MKFINFSTIINIYDVSICLIIVSKLFIQVESIFIKPHNSRDFQHLSLSLSLSLFHIENITSRWYINPFFILSTSLLLRCKTTFTITIVSRITRTLVISESHANVQPRVLKIMSLDIKTTCLEPSTDKFDTLQACSIEASWRYLQVLARNAGLSNRISRLCETDLRSICFSHFPLSLARCEPFRRKRYYV